MALVPANVASSAIADSFLTVTPLTKTRYAHQAIAVTLSKLQVDAFLKSSGNEAFIEEKFKRSHNEMLCKIATYQFWDIVLRLQILTLTFVKAHRENNFDLYVEILEALVPWFFALDHVNYARWVSFHIKI